MSAIADTRELFCYAKCHSRQTYRRQLASRPVYACGGCGGTREIHELGVPGIPGQPLGVDDLKAAAARLQGVGRGRRSDGEADKKRISHTPEVPQNVRAPHVDAKRADGLPRPGVRAAAGARSQARAADRAGSRPMKADTKTPPIVALVQKLIAEALAARPAGLTAYEARVIFRQELANACGLDPMGGGREPRPEGCRGHARELPAYAS